ncbi:trehalose 6-phosphate phosphatase [Epithele typhae]|uniref:trehalose 6-phosphate phosphatase n=1 Tax=Epithele typhae TaxID=378194 RepID=UPI0020084828|nr:trehalose 6-phosphate phosphatase [Epithele typhae]KAH9916960.1 trehalose 6-phosphate phosphatase [Epithele typhae]
MDSFAEPRRLADGAISLIDVRTQVTQLENDLRSKDVPLSGRIIQVCHYLPVIASFARRPTPSDIPSPPATPPAHASDIPPSPTAEQAPAVEQPVEPSSRWAFRSRYGHSAMVSGIDSLSETHDQVFVGWTGDIECATPSSADGESSDAPTNKIPASSVSEEDRAEFDNALRQYASRDENKSTKEMQHVPVWLDDKDAHGHYDGYCKQTLWPLFHYLLWQDVATEYASADSHWAPYSAVNAVFARRVAEIYQPGDLIWIHDYHLLLVPSLIRQTLPDASVGLFVHTPFPSSEVFRCLPRRNEILDGMLGANLICFQTYSYSRHFTSSCIRVCGYEVTSRGGIDVQGHVAAISYSPVGVDADRVAKDILRPGIQPKLEALRTLYEGKKIIVGRDKLDVVKGVVQKLRAFEKLLQDYPQWIGNVVLIQVTSPALSDSPKLERQVSELVAHINGEYGSLDFIPVHHYHQTIKKDEFYALLSVADLGVITPLRDGMNTTSMEFVISQERTKKSPLVLSEFMGISSNMTDAMQINPWNLSEVAAAMHRGLSMSEEEKLSRHQSLYKIRLGSSNMARQTPFMPKAHLESRYMQAKKRLFLFDYDGTLTPIVKVPSAAVPSKDTLLALETLTADPATSWLGMSAEHGGFIREPGQATWSNFTESLDMSWMADVLEIFKYYTERTTGSAIEVKKSAITWHYRSADPEWGLFQCHQCQDLLENNLARKRPIEVLVGKKNLEVRPLAINKGEITPANTRVTLEPPLSVTLLAKDKEAFTPVELAIERDAIFTTAVGHSSKRTLAVWHVTTPEEVVEHMLHLVRDVIPEDARPALADAPEPEPSSSHL